MMADKKIKFITKNKQMNNNPTKKCYYDIMKKRSNSSVSPKIKYSKNKNQMIRTIEEYINHDRYKNTIKANEKVLLANSDTMRIKKKTSYLNSYQNQSFFSSGNILLSTRNESNLKSLNSPDNQFSNYIENENNFQENQYYNTHFNRKHQLDTALSANSKNTSNILPDKKEKLEEEFSETNIFLKQIFIENSSFNKRRNEYLMLYSKLIKFISKKKDLNCKEFTESKIFELNELDLMIFSLFKEKKVYFTFDDFIKLIEKICGKCYSNYEQNPKEYIIKLTKKLFLNNNLVFSENNHNIIEVDNHQNPINDHKNIKEELEMNSMKNLEMFILQFKLDIKIKIILISIIETLAKLYKSYFYFEVNTSTNKQKIEKDSFNSFIKFCKEFDLLPYTFSFELLSNYWNLIIKNIEIQNFISNQKTNLFAIEQTNDPELKKYISISKNLNPCNLGVVFTFVNFCYFLIHFSELSREKEKIYSNKFSNIDNRSSSGRNEKKSNLDYHKSERFLFLLEKLNRSKAFNLFERNLSMAFNSVYSLLPPVKVINLVIPSLIYYDMLESERLKNIKEIHYKKNKRNSIDINKANPDLIDKLKLCKNFTSLIKNENELDNIDICSLIPLEETIAKNLKLFLNDIKEIFDFYCLLFNSYVDENKNKMNFLSFYKFLEDNDLVITINNKNNINFLQSNDLNSVYNKPLENIKLHKLSGQDVLNIFSELISLKNINHTGTSRNLDTENSSKREFEKNLKEKEKRMENDIIFATLDFPLFLKSFEYLSLKIFFNKNILDDLNNESIDKIELLNKSMKKFIDFKIPKFITNYNLKKLLTSEGSAKNKIKEKNLEFIFQEKIQKYLKEIDYLFSPMYKIYSDKNTKLMDFSQLMQFSKDFSLYPDLVNYNCLKEVYQTQVAIMNQINKDELNYNKNFSSKGFQDIEQNEKIDFKCFLNCIALASQYIRYDINSNPVQKFIFLLERIHQSKGLINSMINLSMIK